MKVAGTYQPDNLIAGDFPMVTGEVLLEVGNYKRGALIAQNPEGKYFLLDVAKHDADPQIHKVYGILAEDKTLTSKELAVVYLTGQFSSSEITLGNNGSLNASVKASARQLSLFFV